MSGSINKAGDRTSGERKRDAQYLLLLVILMLISAGWKAYLLLRDVVPFNADEAVVALMARHILQGERPIFFYGQAYMGSLDAYLIAGAFWLFGQQIWAVRLVQILLYMATLGTTYWLGKEAFGNPRTGIIAVLLLAIPVVNVTLYTTATLGGYGETLFLGNLILLVTFRVARKPSPLGIGIWGGLVGLGLWVNGLTLVFSFPSLFFLVWSLKTSSPEILLRFALSLICGALLGSLPLWIFIARSGLFSIVSELSGSAVNVEQLNWLSKIGVHSLYLFLLGLPAMFGLRPPWNVEWLGFPLIPFVLLSWVSALLFGVRKIMTKGDNRPAFWLLGGVILVLSVGFIFTSFGVDPSGRYFLPLAIPFALLFAEWALSLDQFRQFKIPSWGKWIVIGILVIYQFWGNAQVAWQYPPGFTTQFDQETILDSRDLPQLIEFLEENGETRGYTNYWVSYPLIFLSNETLIFTPRLPYHSDMRYTGRDNRYLPYEGQVNESDKTAYISTVRTPILSDVLRSGFKSLNVKHQEKAVGDYIVFYALSRPVRPEDLGLGSDHP